MRKLLLVIGAFVVLVAFTFIFTLLVIDRDRSERCENLLAIAGDEEKIAYLYEWIGRNLKNKELLESLGYVGKVNSIDDKDSLRSLRIDWAFLGMNSDYASLSVIRLSKDLDDFTNPHNIKAVGFGEGRNSVILKLDPDFKTESLGGGEHRREIQVVNDKVSVYCD